MKVDITLTTSIGLEATAPKNPAIKLDLEMNIQKLQ